MRTTKDNYARLVEKDGTTSEFWLTAPSPVAKRVTPEMTDADVNGIYEHAVPRRIGLSHEIDKLRREYLQKKSVGQPCRAVF